MNDAFRLTLLLCTACVLTVPAVVAQPAVTVAEQPGVATPAELDPRTASLTVGYLGVNLAYASAHNGFVYSFNGPTTALMLSSDVASLTVAYGSQQLDEAATGSAERLIDVALITGGNAYLFDRVGDLPLGLFVPIRIHLGYRNLSLDVEDEVEVDEGEIGTLHLANVGLGAGGGLRMRIPTTLPILQNNLVAATSLVIAYGGMADVGGGVEQVHLARTTDFNIEAKWERAMGMKVGLTVGYTYRTTFWSDDYLDDIEDVEEVLDSDLDNFDQRSRSHLLRIGINW